jgi:hypothetical protein
MDQKLENEIMNNAPDITTPQLDIDELTSFMDQLKQLDQNQKDILFSNLSKLNTINPNNKEYEEFDKNTYIKNKLHNKLKKNNTESEQDIGPNTLRNRKRRLRRKKQKQQDEQLDEPVQEQQDEHLDEPVQEHILAKSYDYTDEYEIISEGDDQKIDL